MPGWLENPDDGLGERIRGLLDGLWADLRGLDERVAELDAEIAAIAEEDPAAQRLQQLRRRSSPQWINQIFAGTHHPRLPSKSNDREQVEPAPAKPASVHVREARKTDWEPAREQPIMARYRKPLPGIVCTLTVLRSYGCLGAQVDVDRPDVAHLQALVPAADAAAFGGSLNEHRGTRYPGSDPPPGEAAGATYHWSLGTTLGADGSLT